MTSLPDEIQSEIKVAYEALKSNLDNFKDRFQQRKMIALVANTLFGNQEAIKIAMIEGPTGTGKTLAYLLGAIPVAKYLNKKLVITSSTVALQEQLILKDIPIIKNNTNYEFTVNLAKGRSRYVCLTRLASLADGEIQQNLLAAEEVAAWNEPPSKIEVRIVNSLFKDYKDKTWNGEIDTCKVNISKNLWSQINNNFHACSGSKCPEYNRCVFYIERRKLGNSNVIVANHDLMLTDIASGDAKVLPPISDSLYIFDEAHHLPNKAVEHFSASASVLGATEWLKGVPKVLATEIKGINKKDIAKLCKSLIDGLLDLHQAIVDNGLKPNSEQKLRFKFGKTPEFILQIGSNQIWDFLEILCKKLRSALKIAKDNLDSMDKQAIKKEQQISALSFLVDRIDNLHKLWFLMLKKPYTNEKPFVRWIKFTDNDFILNVAPINASQQLQENLWQRVGGCVLTSATLTALNSFERIQELSGLTSEISKFVRLSSPFDFSKVDFIIPKMKTTPKDISHTHEVTEILPNLINNALGNLVLFNSYKQMEAVYEALPNKLKTTIQVQGETSIENILKQHAKNIAANKPSSLFGVNSFAEGLDLPGKLCEQVIVAKLPFAVPTSPREEAYSEWVESLGKNSFFSISVPDASMRLIQACGRLIRTEQDHGNIVILDTRLATTSYGKSMLKALPSYNFLG